VSALYEVQPDRLIVASDPVFIFGKGELGAEGRDRLTPLTDTLLGLVSQLPDEFPWRLRIEGHSDSRPLRSNKRFESNWELSAARAVSMLRFLVAQGLPEARLSAVGLADNRLRDPGDSSAAHRRNRRIEIHLIYVPTSPD
jgi:chemotaxis protein MotB